MHINDMRCVRLLFSALLVASCSQGRADVAGSSGWVPSASALNGTAHNDAMHLTVDARIGDIVRHPAFAGHGRLLLPWDGQDYDEQMPLTRIGSLLPYHSHVEPHVVVDALNRMIDDAERGQTIFYRFYTPAERRNDPTKENTGLFFFRGKPGAPFAIIAPGGGFTYVGSVHEGFPYALEISNRGYNAFVLRYRPGLGERAATEDLAAALSYLFRNSAELGIDTASYSAWGSSAGARIAANIGSHGLTRFGGDDRPKPLLVVMAYTGHSEYTMAEPPTFVVVGEQDGIAPPAVMERRVAALRSLGTNVEYHRYAGVGHGFGLGTGTSAEGWIGEAIRFWEEVIKRGR